MKLQSMRLQNFRQFFGEQEIDFAAPEGGRNVTVFHGYNGAGKTALLNAFIWCLYGQTTSDLEAPERLETERAVAEAMPGAEVKVSVRLVFVVHGERYIVERRRAGTKESGATLRIGDTELSLWVIGPNGELNAIGANDRTNDRLRQNRIDQILPPDLYPFFFFNGERVERLASKDAYDRIESGVTTLLDVKIFERGTTHLRRHVAPALAEQLSKYGDADLQAAIAEQQRHERREQEIQEELKQARENVARLEEEIETYEQKQRSLEAIKDLTEKRERLRDDLRNCEDRIEKTDEDLASAISRDGYLVFADSVFRKTEELVAAARQRGDLPAKIKPQFVDDLLAEQTCICGRPLPPGSPEEAKLLHWRNATGLAELEEAISQTHAAIPPLRERRSRHVADLDRLMTRRSELLTERRRLHEELDTVEAQCGDTAYGEEAARLADHLKSINRDLVNRKADIKFLDEKLAENEEKRSDIRQRIKQLQVHDAKGALIKRQKESVDRVADALEEITRIQKDDVRQDLDEQIGEIWRDAAIKDYRASVSEDYRLLLTKKVSGVEQPVHGASTGEKQVLALSFVASLVKKAEQNLRESETESPWDFLTGGQYPLVMDSPFGALEDDYRQKVAEWVPNIAQQVIVMASTTQWRNEVEKGVYDRIGKRYILELHTSKEGADRQIEIDGHSYPYVIADNDPAECTIVREVREES